MWTQLTKFRDLRSLVLNKFPKSDAPTSNDFPVVGLGASAGGIDAYKRFLKAIPENSGMAYVLVQHLDPTHESILPEILAKVTSLPVREITDDIHLEPNNIYVIPENKILTSTDGILQLSPRPKNAANPSIDIFFTSLAEVHQNLAVGIVLSGNGSDGTQGLKAIKAFGGLTFAQDQSSAAHPDMPRNAAHAHAADFIMPPEDMPSQLYKIMFAFATDADAQLAEDEAYEMNRLMQILQKSSGVDFSYYKKTTITRRIARRMALNKIDSLKDYVGALSVDKVEKEALFNDLLIPVTAFFRDNFIFDCVQEKILPVLLAAKTDSPLRIWIAGCSSGQEAYSLAIMLRELTLSQDIERKIQIFASDISQVSITKARYGEYPANVATQIPEKLLKRYFKKTATGYQISREIRDMCVFAVHNFLVAPPYAKLDLISCRNVLIYMNTELQNKALNTFHYALNETGYLILGKSESIAAASALFNPFAKKEKIFSRKKVSGRMIPLSIPPRQFQPVEKPRKKSAPLINQPDYLQQAEELLLNTFTPCGVIVNESGEVVHIHGNITPYLELNQGKPTFNLIKMAREGLSYELRNALHQAKVMDAGFKKEDIRVQHNDQTLSVNIVAVKLEKSSQPHYLIIFTNSINKPKTGKSKKNNAVATQASEDTQMRIIQLEKELAQTQLDVNAITSEQEASNEELQSANEELLSGSEELQSLNEELETSKEELQSSNEELITMNRELSDKQDELDNSLVFAEAIITTIREPLIVLDKNLKVMFSNESYHRKFLTKESDIVGKPFYKIQDGFWNNRFLNSLLEKVLPQRTQLNDYEILVQLPPFGECTLLLNARQIINQKSSEQMILLAIEDITELKISQAILKESEAKFKLLADANIIGVATWKLSGSIQECNHAFLKIIGYSQQQLFEHKISWFDCILPQERSKYLAKMKLAIKKKTVVPYPTVFIHKDKVTVPVMLGYSFVRDSEDSVIAFVQNLTNFKEAEARIAILEQSFESGKLKN